jgi:DNA-binding beta-propeller fold protein YncE
MNYLVHHYLTEQAEGRPDKEDSMRRVLVSLFCTSSVACSADGPSQPLAADLIFAAVEDDGTLAVLDGETGALLRTVDLSDTAHSERVKLDVHNVQVGPDGRTVWLTAMPSEEDGSHTGEPMPEQLVGVDAVTLAVTTRIELGSELHAAHVVISGTTGYVTANEADVVVVVDLAEKKVVSTIALPAGTGPHGARVTADGRTLVVAGMTDGSLQVVDTSTGSVTSYDLPGRAVQTAILPDGSVAFATIYDTRQVARLDLTSKALTLFDMPAGSAGPVQLYPAPDGRSVWVADQGLIDGEPAGNSLVQLDATSGEILRTALVDPGPHGVVMNQAGTRAWTTTLVNGTVQSIDAGSGAVLTTTPVGNRPNGISCSHPGGVMP